MAPGVFGPYAHIGELGVKVMKYLLTMLLLLVLTAPVCAAPAPELAILPNGQGGFTLRAERFSGISSGEIQIFFETEGPATPRVSAVGLGARAELQVVADSGSIVIRLTTSSPLRGSGHLATVQLAAPEWGAGRVTYLSAALVNDKGEAISPQTRIENPQPDEGKPAPDAQGAKARKRIPPGPGLSSTPGSGAVDSGREAQVTTPPQRKEPERMSRPGDPRYRRLESVLERFRTRTGEPTPAEVETLFAPNGAGVFRQEPAVQLSDGVAEVRVSIGQIGEGEEAKFFLVSGGRFSSLREGAPGEWVLALVPERGALSVSVTVQTAKQAVEYPLTVAPPLELFDAGAAQLDPRLVQYVTLANQRVLLR